MINMAEQAQTERAPVGFSVDGRPKQVKRAQKPLQEMVDSLKSAQDDIGQIAELISEEKSLVAEFFLSFLNLMQPLATSISVDPGQISNYVVNVVQANLAPTGYLAVVYNNGQMELKNLSDEKNRDLLIDVIEDVIPRFKQLTNDQKSRIENRIKFLTAVAKEMQKMSKALTAATSQQQ
jgi:hypothetical protein